MADLTKAEKVDQLKTLGVEAPAPEDTTHKELDELLSFHTPQTTVASEAIVEDVEPVNEVTVSYEIKQQPFTRVFSRAVHGDVFLDKAKQFAEKFSGTIL